MKFGGVGTTRSARWSDNGQVLPFAALIIAIVLGMGALATDVGFYMHERQNVQNAVDAGALAGAQLLPGNGTGAATAATNFVLANDHNLKASDVQVSFRCLVANVAADVPGWCDPKADAAWTVSSQGQQVSPCVPANGDACNVIVVSASSTQKYFLAPAIGIKNGSTGSIKSAACSGTCGGPPSKPVDVMMIDDRTASMSAADITNVRNATSALLQTYNPALQWVGLGLLGPSKTSTACTGVNSPAKALADSSVAGYTPPTYLPQWIPVGLTGTGAGAPGYNESYVNANGTLNTSSMIVKALTCFDHPGGTGTDLATPIRMASYYLQHYGRAGVRKGIVLETDGQPNAGPTAGPNYCAQANTEATAAKNAGIEIFTIGFGLDGALDVNCPDTSGAFLGKKATYILASVATQPSTDPGCVPAANTDGDHFFCEPKTGDLTSIFQAVAGSLAAGGMLIPLP